MSELIDDLEHHTMQNIRHCDKGWMGENCEIPICSNGCSQGKCVKPEQCHCKRGWTGKSCNVPISTQAPSSMCNQETFNDGICDEENNNEVCGFDGGDCCDFHDSWDSRCKTQGKVSTVKP